jgi:hypothetical protein
MLLISFKEYVRERTRDEAVVREIVEGGMAKAARLGRGDGDG